MRVGAKYWIAERDEPTIPQPSLPESPTAAVSDLPPSVPHASTPPEDIEPHLQQQDTTTRVDRNAEKMEVKRKSAVSRLQKARDATKRAKAKLDKEAEAAKLKIEKDLKEGEAKAKHARVVDQESETKIDKITKAATAKVDLSMRAGDVKIDRARKALQAAGAKKDRARDEVQELLAKQQELTADKESTRSADRVDDGDDDDESDSSE
ncbi:MAG: hypothetical protein Q9168_002856 [Polycauliona sp. 1 TL-2023]